MWHFRNIFAGKKVPDYCFGWAGSALARLAAHDKPAIRRRLWQINGLGD